MKAGECDYILSTDEALISTCGENGTNLIRYADWLDFSLSLGCVIYGPSAHTPASHWQAIAVYTQPETITAWDERRASKTPQHFAQLSSFYVPYLSSNTYHTSPLAIVQIHQLNFQDLPTYNEQMHA